jgi:hypothetical protein
VKFEIKRVQCSPERPHGLRYAFTLHRPDGRRLLGFDNAHGVPQQGARYRKVERMHDHWHRNGEDEGRPYAFTTAAQLVTDFQTEVERTLTELGVGDLVIDSDETTGRARS